MKNRLSVIMVTRNAQDLLPQSLMSVKDIASEIVIVDAGSHDDTIAIARGFQAKLYRVKTNHLGRNKALALSKATGSWILMLDSDEMVSPPLQSEIRKAMRRKSVDGYVIRFKNHYLGKPLRYGGEQYKMFRLFRKNKGVIKQVAVHENVIPKSDRIVVLKHPILHFSYRSLVQMYLKFTTYALDEAEEKRRLKERSSLTKIILYPAHMFWARFIKDKGYKDGMFRIPLDFGFAYMEFLTYISLAIKPA